MKRFCGLLLGLMLVLCCFSHAWAENCATKVELYCTVKSDGDCLVSMTVNLHLDGSDGGLTFPLPGAAKSITMNGSSVSASSGLVPLNRITGGMTGDFPVRFDFVIPEAVKVNANRQLQLTLPMACGFDYPISAMSFIITLPDNITTTPSFTGKIQQAGFESNVDVVINGNMITGSTRNGLLDHEEVTMTMTVPQSMFPSVSIYQREGNPELVPMAVCLGLALLYWLMFLRTLPPMRQRATVPPEGISAGELDCRITMTGGDLTMMVMSWAQMGYLKIHLEPNRRVYLQKRMEMGNERSLFEIRVFQSLFQKQNVVSCTGAAYAKLCRKTAGMVPGEKAMCYPNSGNRKVFRILLCIGQFFCGICVAMNMTSILLLQIIFSVIFGILSAVSAWFIQEFAFAIRRRYRNRAWAALAICGAWVLMGLIAGQPWIPMGAVAVQLLMGYLAAYGGMRTELNRSEVGEILAIRRFMRRIPRPEAARLLKLDPEYFYRMAPYAIALGVDQPFAAAFGRRKLEDCPYLVTRARSRHTAEEWMALMKQCTYVMDRRYRRTQLEKWLAIRLR